MGKASDAHRKSYDKCILHLVNRQTQNTEQDKSDKKSMWHTILLMRHIHQVAIDNQILDNKDMF